MAPDLPEQEMEPLSQSGEKLSAKEPDGLEDLDDVDHLPDTDYTLEEENVIMRKMDKRVVGLVALLYLLSFLDRSSMIKRICGLLATNCDPRYWQCEDCWSNARSQA
jgi:hypothetical protein